MYFLYCEVYIVLHVCIFATLVLDAYVWLLMCTNFTVSIYLDVFLQIHLTVLLFLRRMASSSSVLSEEQLQCSICLDVFTDPVSTPCGHNFCRDCLKTCWDCTQYYSCPMCKETFKKRPELRVNTTFREIVDHFQKRCNDGERFVRCDVCTEKCRRAVKSCLNCETSFCETHMEPHKIAPKLREHALIDPVENLEDYVCQNHKRPLDLFCRSDQVCVCHLCTQGDHKSHEIVPLKEESDVKRVFMFLMSIMSLHIDNFKFLILYDYCIDPLTLYWTSLFGISLCRPRSAKLKRVYI